MPSYRLAVICVLACTVRFWGRPRGTWTGRASGMIPAACGTRRWIRSTGRMCRLKPVWTYHTGELKGVREDDRMYADRARRGDVPHYRVCSRRGFDAATGKELWQFDPFKDHPFGRRLASGGVNRGCAYWSIACPTESGGSFTARPTGGCLPRRQDRQAGSEVRRRGGPQSAHRVRSEGGGPFATDRRRPR